MLLLLLDVILLLPLHVSSCLELCGLVEALLLVVLLAFPVNSGKALQKKAKHERHWKYEEEKNSPKILSTFSHEIWPHSNLFCHKSTRKHQFSGQLRKETTKEKNSLLFNHQIIVKWKCGSKVVFDVEIVWKTSAKAPNHLWSRSQLLTNWFLSKKLRYKLKVSGKNGSNRKKSKLWTRVGLVTFESESGYMWKWKWLPVKVNGGLCPPGSGSRWKMKMVSFGNSS